MNTEEIKRRYEKALEVADKAAAFLLSHESLRSNISSKAKNDFVTIADKECEALIHRELGEAFPEDGFYGEESGDDGKAGCRWIVDPIDGTVDFMSDFPNYTVSIAFEDEEGLAVGVVTIPRQKEVFSAFRNGGAYLNGKPIHTDEAKDYSRTLAILVPPHRRHELMDHYMPRMMKFYDVFTDMRSIGSAAASLCYVAAGRCAAYYELSLFLYDMAAGNLIVKEAGGRFTMIEEFGRITIAASSSSIHDKVLELIK